MPSFRHWPKGSLIGSGVVKLRHYGSEEVSVRIYGNGSAYASVTINGVTYRSGSTVRVPAGTQATLHVVDDSNSQIYVNSSRLFYRNIVDPVITINADVSISLDWGTYYPSETEESHYGTITASVSDAVTSSVGITRGAIILTSLWYYKINGSGKQVSETASDSYVLSTDVISVWAMHQVIINGTNYGSAEKQCTINGSAAISVTNEGSPFSPKYTVTVTGNVIVV